MICCIELSTSETISLIAAIGAVISALCSAVAAIIMSKQNWTRINVNISNDISTDLPQNIYNVEGRFSLSCISIENLSPRPITISDCFIEIDKKKISALHENMNFYLYTQEIGVKLSASTSRILYRKSEKDNRAEIDQFTRIPIELSPFQSKEVFLFFPDFIQSNLNILFGKICFRCGNKKICKKIIIHKLLGIN